MAQEPSAIGRMRRRLVLEGPVAAPDGLGGATQVFETVAALWAQIEWISGTEAWRQGRPEQSRNYRITMRWRGTNGRSRRCRRLPPPWI